MKKRYLVADVGGSRVRIGLATHPGPTGISVWYHATRDLSSLHDAIKEVMSEARSTGILIKSACIAAAGPIVNNTCTPPHIPWTIDGRKLQQQLGVPCKIVNDVQAMMHGIPFLSKQSLQVIQKGQANPLKPSIALASGTGLGKAILVPSKESTVLQSEGGHGDFPFQPAERDLCMCFHKQKGPIQQEQVLSGKGIEDLYAYFRKGVSTNPILARIDESKEKPVLISTYRKRDPVCRETMSTYAKFSARVLRNFCLDTLPLGGAYLCGGIAARNPDIFTSKVFLQEFWDSSPLFRQLLNKIPVNLVLDDEVGLYGATFLAAGGKL